MGALRRTKDDRVVRITSAPETPAQDINHRERRYLISMAIRTICFIGAILTTSIPWLCGILIAGSFLLPYVAVVMANSASPRVETALPPGPGTGSRELEGPDPRDTP